MDEAMCFIILGWHYGYKTGWDVEWQKWFREKAQRFADSWNSVPYQRHYRTRYTMDNPGTILGPMVLRKQMEPA